MVPEEKFDDLNDGQRLPRIKDKDSNSGHRKFYPGARLSYQSCSDYATQEKLKRGQMNKLNLIPAKASPVVHSKFRANVETQNKEKMVKLKRQQTYCQEQQTQESSHEYHLMRPRKSIYDVSKQEDSLFSQHNRSKTQAAHMNDSTSIAVDKSRLWEGEVTHEMVKGESASSSSSGSSLGFGVDKSKVVFERSTSIL